MTNVVHSRETIDTVRRYWNVGMTATAIGRQMGMTKDQIIGISYRNDFRMRSTRGMAYRRVVITPSGTYPSIRAAARACGMSYSGGAWRVRHQSMGWRFADE